MAQTSIVVGYTGSHKSEFARHCAHHASLNGYGVIHVDIELGARWICGRYLSHLSQVPFTKVKNEQMRSEAENAAITAARNRLMTNPFMRFICPNGAIGLGELEGAIAEAKASIGPCKGYLLILDSVQRLAAGYPEDNPRLQVTGFMNWTEAIAKRLGVAVLAVSEQKRDQKGGVPKSADILTSGAESRSVEFVAAVVLGLYQDKKLDEMEAEDANEFYEDKVSLVLAKNRHGVKGRIQEDVSFLHPIWGMKCEKVTLSTIENDVLNALSTEEHYSSVKIAKMVKRSKKTVLSVLKSLEVEEAAYYKKNKGWVKIPQNIRRDASLAVPEAGTARIEVVPEIGNRYDLFGTASDGWGLTREEINKIYES